jgi:YD repeat-containing protein
MLLGTSLALISALAAILFLLPLQPGDAKTASSQNNQQGARSDAETSHGQPPALSDREKAGLHGPVEECTEESTTPPSGNSPAWKMVYTTKYDRDGRIYQTGYVNNDGSKGTQSLTYDAEGHLLTKVWEAQGKTSATIYNYDTQGRLIGITDERDWTTSFEYDQGRKTRIVKSRLNASSTDDQSRLVASIESENADLFVAPPPGGSVKTSFNDRDQPVEAQVYGPNGDLLKRLTRTYDSKGRVLESSLVIEDADSILPPDAVKRIAAEPGGAEELEKELARFLGDQRVLAHSSYVYDDQGRVIEKHRRFGPSGETITKITYNDQGDEAQAIATTPDAPSSPQQPGTLYKYRYDNFGNWIERTVSSASTGTKPAKIWSTEHRTITYY